MPGRLRRGNERARVPVPPEKRGRASVEVLVCNGMAGVMAGQVSRP